MYKKVIKYTDYNGVEREEPFYFNLNKAELVKWEGSTLGGMRAMYDKIIAAQDKEALISLFETIIQRAYGEKSPDGKRFMKSPDILANFTSTEAYSNLFMELASNDESAAAFMEGIMPADLLAEAQKASAEEGANPALASAT